VLPDDVVAPPIDGKNRWPRGTSRKRATTAHEGSLQRFRDAILPLHGGSSMPTRRELKTQAILLLAALTGPLVPLQAGEGPPGSGTIRLERVSVAALRVNPNLLPHAGFEDVAPGGSAPAGWIWERRNTDATCVTVDNLARSGRRSLRITNGTAFGAHVYGTLWQEKAVRLELGRPYTFSAWVKSDVPGIVSLVAGQGWQFRAQASSTGGRWQRIAVTFTPGEQDRDFRARINTESPTQGVWIDDVKLEAGPEPTLDPPTGDATARTSLEPDQRTTEVQGDGPFRLSFTCWAPRIQSCKAVASLGSGETVENPVELAAGFQRLVIHATSSAAHDAPRSLTLRLTGAVGGAAQAASEVRLYSSAGVLDRLAALEKNLPEIRKDLDTLRAAGQDPSYPQVAARVLEEFIPYTRGDARHGEVKRALREVDELERMTAKLKSALRNGLEGRRIVPPVPRWTAGERPAVRGGSFVGRVRWPDGTEAVRPLFFTGYGHFARVVTDMEKWPALGTNIIQIELGPNSVFPAEGVTDEAPVRRILQILDRAQKSGVAVCLLISPHYMPDWALRKWPHLRKHRNGFLNFCLHAPEGQDLLRRFVAATIAPLKDHPALQSICLSNEPVNQEEPCDFARAEWRAWLEKRHGDLAQLNRHHGAHYASFAAVPLPDPFGPRPPAPLWMDYIRFNQEFFARWHTMLADAVHKAAPAVPVHAKAMNWTMLNDGDIALGVDATLFGRFSDINGNDAVNFYGSPTDEFAQGWQANAIGQDLQRSVRQAPVFNTENHIIADRETRAVPPEHVRAALWQAAVHGQGATTIWVWERTYDPRSDFAGSILERPACVEAVGRANLDLNRAAIEVTALQQVRPRVLLLHGTSSLVWDTGRHAECRNQLYTALAFLGIKTGFVTERQLEAGDVPEASVVLVPDAVHLSDDAVAALRRFAGRLVLVGGDDVLSSDEYGHTRAVTIDAERLLWRHGKNTWRDLWQTLPARLTPWGVRSPLTLTNERGEPVWGVEWQTAETRDGLVLNLCNERHDSVTVQIQAGRTPATFKDVLTGETAGPALTLKPLDVRLLKSDRR
jgi:hypothetical protein